VQKNEKLEELSGHLLWHDVHVMFSENCLICLEVIGGWGVMCMGVHIDIIRLFFLRNREVS
jgi:hypothetical protein